MRTACRASAASSEAPKARLLIVALLRCSFCSPRALLHCALSVLLAPLSLSHCTRGRKKGGGGRGGRGNRDSSLGGLKVCVCVRERMRAKQIGALVYSIGDSVIQTCGFCNPRRGQRTRSSSTTGSSEGGDPLHCPLYPPPPFVFALGETQQLQHAQSAGP